jgi:hypothetical protein
MDWARDHGDHGVTHDVLFSMTWMGHGRPMT